MRVYHKLFETPSAGHEYVIPVEPWIGTVRSTGQNIDHVVIGDELINENEVLIVSHGNTLLYLTDGSVVTIEGTSLTATRTGIYRDSLVKCIVGNNVTRLAAAFNNFTNLHEVTIPNSVVTIDNTPGCFANSENLTTINISDDNQITSISDYFCDCCYNLTHITIPNNVTSIGTRAFKSCGLINVDIPSGVITIGEYAFADCSSLTSITINAIIPPTIDPNSFYNTNNCPIYVPADSFEDYYTDPNWNDYKDRLRPIGASLIVIENNTTQGIICCTNKETIFDFPWILDNEINTKTHTSDIQDFYENFTIKKIILGSQVTGMVNFLTYALGFYDILSNVDCFEGFDNITYCDFNPFTQNSTLQSIFNENIFLHAQKHIEHLVIPNGIKMIAGAAAGMCNDLTTVTIPSTVEKIYADAFADTGLTSVIIPNSVKYIGEDVFKDCTSLSSVTLSNQLQTIKQSMFYGCSSLASITIPDSVLKIDQDVFNNSGLLSITIPSSVTSVGKSLFANCNSLQTVNLQCQITEIPDSMFNGCSVLTGLTIPNSVTKIGENVFASSGITSMIIPNYVTEVGRWAFGSCSSLTSLTVSNSVTKIPSRMCMDCTSLTSVVIPSSVTKIESESFYGCSSLTSVTIPDSVTSIGSNAFNDCTSLTSITCEATTPPIVGYSPFYNSLSHIYVPAASVDAYKAAEGWSTYASKIEAINS